MILSAVTVLSLSLLWLIINEWNWNSRFIELFEVDCLQSTESTFAPHVCVVMALRGADPYLDATLRSLFQMDYPSFEIRIVIDNESDPAVEVVNRVLSERQPTNVSIQILNVFQESCGLKNLALVQAIELCSDRCEILAWMDSDAIPGPGWLSSMVRPLQDQSVGVTSGIRWYSLPDNSLGNHVRHLWNAAALLRMKAFGIGWGGSFAIRRDVFEVLDIASKLRKSLVEDTMISSEVLMAGGQIRFVSAATMLSMESTSLRWCLHFITRQLQMVRHYHHSWSAIQMYGVVSGMVLFALTILTILCSVSGELLSSAIAAAALLTYCIGVNYLMNRSDACVRKSLGIAEVSSLPATLMRLIAAPVCQIAHLIAVVGCRSQREIQWRGIRYKVDSAFEVRRLNYAPFCETVSPSHASL